jgi:Putative restriction endonuclease
MAESSQLESVWEVPDRLRLELLARLSTKATRPARMSYEEFLEWADEDTLAEWVDGEVVMTSPATSMHQELVSFLDQVLSTYVRVHDLGAIRVAPFHMKLPERCPSAPEIPLLIRDTSRRESNPASPACRPQVRRREAWTSVLDGSPPLPTPPGAEVRVGESDDSAQVSAAVRPSRLRLARRTSSGLRQTRKQPMVRYRTPLLGDSWMSGVDLMVLKPLAQMDGLY